MARDLWVSTRKGLFHLTRSSDSGPWSICAVHFLGEPVSICLPDRRDGSVYAALNLGHFGAKLHRSDDKGKSWTEVGVPAYPAGATTNQRQNGENVVKPASLDQIWCLEPAGPAASDGLWAGTIPGGLFKSTDRAATWTLNTGLWNRPERANWFGGGYDQPGIHSICVDPRDHRKVLLAVSCGGVWRTTDGGETWGLSCKGMIANYMPPDRQEDQEVQDPHRMSRSTGNPDTLWVQHHGGIFVTHDDAKTWKAVTGIRPSDFGFAVVAHPTQKNTAWFVPAIKDQYRVPADAKLVVARTDDGGTGCEVIQVSRQGQASYDLVYRHGLDGSTNGRNLAMGSTTGHIWTSDDAGKSWQQLADFLPPIYAIRFGE